MSARVAPPETEAKTLPGEPNDTEASSEEIAAFDYARPADIFTRRNALIAADASRANAERARSRSTYRNSLNYRRFASGAEAIRFAIEELSPQAFAASVIVSDGDRREAAAIRLLYANVAYPLPRRATARKA
jgi:hypothetical protein